MKLPIYKQRMFELMEYVLKHNINYCKTQQHFMDSIGYGAAGNLSNIKNGVQSFRLEHYLNAINTYSLDANYFFKEEAPMFDLNKNIPAIHRLNEAVAAVSRELYHSKIVSKPVPKNKRNGKVSVMSKSAKQLKTS